MITQMPPDDFEEHLRALAGDVTYDTSEQIDGGLIVKKIGADNATSLFLVLDGRRQENDEANIHSWTLNSGDRVHAFSHKGSMRDYTQDGLLVDPKTSSVMIADGFGKYGREVANILIAYAIHHSLDPGTFLDKTQRTIREIRRLLPVDLCDDESVSDVTRKSLGGSTIGYVHIHRDEATGNKSLRLLYRGDTNIAVIREGNVVYRTIDQTYGQRLREDLRKNNLLNPMSDQACRTKDHILYNAIDIVDKGDTNTIDEFGLTKGDLVVIGCDGVMKNRSNNQLTQGLLGFNTKQFAQWLFEEGYRDSDNITAAVIDIT